MVGLNERLAAVRACAARAGIDRDISPHWFRHSHATHALQVGAPVHVVQAALGHKSLATTTLYAHASGADASANYLD